MASHLNAGLAHLYDVACWADTAALQQLKKTYSDKIEENARRWHKTK